ncbi:hypothetical protein J3A64_004731 [Pseudarthrobacter sp. PvP004]|jgi:hypothetical protein|uniref:hypothetical protein n=1 Tax=Pseudarthrobacter sp. PvP004 TaxID=2817850 RepID=UPI001AE30181|nr:hypothetical protein [Pseudarthrobacter sp. PvP004]MBP2269191.1 hypothetical protein [Pseudarthrobacter sp. PvP004]
MRGKQTKLPFTDIQGDGTGGLIVYPEFHQSGTPKRAPVGGQGFLAVDSTAALDRGDLTQKE